MTACQMASLLAKCLNTAPWLTPTTAAISAVVMSGGLASRARCSAAATISACRASVGRRGARCMGMMAS